MSVKTSFDINGLPEDCIATALSLTTPKDVCRLSTVASAFRSAARSDCVWERFLPSDYRDIISRSVDGADSLLGQYCSKRDLYFHLSDHSILIDDGLKSFTLEKWTGKKCYMLAARDLYIVWGDTCQYWQWISLPESRFSEAAELLAVCWFEIHGFISAEMLSPGTNYAAYLVFMSKSGVYGFDHTAAEASVGIIGQEMSKQAVSLGTEAEHRRWHDVVPRQRMGLLYHRLGRPRVQQQIERQQPNEPMDANLRYPKRRDDGWMETELGEYLVKGDEDGAVEISLMEVKGGHWKSGIIIQGIEIRPKE